MNLIDCFYIALVLIGISFAAFWYSLLPIIVVGFLCYTIALCRHYIPFKKDNTDGSTENDYNQD